MISSLQRTVLASSIALVLGACGGGAGESASSPGAPASAKLLATVVAGSACPALALSGIDAQTLTGATTPLQMGNYGSRVPGAPVLIGGKHSPANYRAAPVLPAWQFATLDPTNGALTFECDVAPVVGWHSYKRNGSSHQQVVVTGGRNAAPQHIYPALFEKHRPSGR
jgi:pectate lyase